MTPLDLKQRLLRSFHFYQSSTAPTSGHTDTADALNAAFQEIWSAPNSAQFSRQQQSFATVASTTAYSLADSIQRVLGHVRCNGVTLSEIVSQSTFDNYQANLAVSSTAPSSPKWYFVDRNYAGAGSTDPEALTLQIWLAPAPTAVYMVTFEASMEPPQYTSCDLETDSGSVPMPHSKVESILLPLARYHLAQSSWMTDKNLRAVYASKRQEVLTQLGWTEPSQAKRETKGEPNTT